METQSTIITSKEQATNIINEVFKDETTKEIVTYYTSVSGSPHMLWQTLMDNKAIADTMVLQNRAILDAVKYTKDDTWIEELLDLVGPIFTEEELDYFQICGKENYIKMINTILVYTIAGTVEFRRDFIKYFSDVQLFRDIENISKQVTDCSLSNDKDWYLLWSNDRYREYLKLAKVVRKVCDDWMDKLLIIKNKLNNQILQNLDYKK